jgi:formimidoylglutamate deiminase
MTSRYLAPVALLPDGWANDVLIETDAAGDIVAVTADSPRDGASHLPGPVLPGMPNVHSHAFQRALAGRAERRAEDGRDSFWTWRETMYAFVARLEPDDLEAIAGWAYAEMLKGGYTSVGEFHYVHNAPDGSPYAARTEMADRLVAASRASGIGLTLLPVLYAHGGFGGAPPSDQQRRFTLDADGFCALWDDLARSIAGHPQLALGVAPHSLRAVSTDQLAQVVAHVAAASSSAPIHLHVAEQLAEVDACVAWSGQRPVAWLLDHAPVSERWCLVHATHVDDAERMRAAATGAVAGLCPTTEANLGDGIFPADAWLRDRGRIGIGSDSNVAVDPAEELRWLEYGQRLTARRRAVLCGSDRPSVGGTLYRAALAGGAAALARPVGRVAPGYRADLVVLDGSSAVLEGAAGDELLDRYIFGGAHALVRDVMVGGQWAVVERRCTHETGAKARYVSALKRLFGDGLERSGQATFPSESE